MTLILTLTGNAQSIAEGDLAFVVSQHENAITQVTQGINNLAIDHVAIMHRIGGEDGPLYAIEAYPRHGVCLTPIDSLLQRDGTGSVIFARVNNVDAHKSVTQALTHVGKPYDRLLFAPAFFFFRSSVPKGNRAGDGVLFGFFQNPLDMAGRLC